MPQRYWATLTAIAVLLASWLVCYRLTDATDQLDMAAARVAEVPRDFGDWHGQDETVDDSLFDNAGAKAHWTRLYVHQRTQESVLAILMCGRAGRMAVHTPEVCYRGAGFELPGEASAYELKGAPGQEPARFFTAQFTKKAGTPTRLRLFWAWNAQGQWEASSSPRWQFRGAPFLYKLYVSRTLHGPTSSQSAADPAADFLRQFVPVVNRTLFPES